MLVDSNARRPGLVSVPLMPKPLEEAAWHAWAARGRVQDRRDNVARARTIKWLTIAGLLVAAALWSRLPPFEAIVRSAVASGALILMFRAVGAQRNMMAIIFGTLALLYNPVLPVVGFSGNWQRYLAVASAAPFVASLAWRNARLASID